MRDRLVTRALVLAVAGLVPLVLAGQVVLEHAVRALEARANGRAGGC